MFMKSTTKDFINRWPGPDGSDSKWELDGLGLSDDTWADILKAIPAVVNTGLEVYGTKKNIELQNALASRGVMPVAYQNGVPVYYSPPSGVSPNNPYAGQQSLPSGLAVPPGVTPSYSYYAQPTAPYVDTFQQYLPYIAIGGGLLLLVAFMR